jgi:HEAT repeat protein
MTDRSVELGDTGPKKTRSRFGVTSVVLLVGALGALSWVGYRVWDDMNLDDATRRFREGLRQVRSKDPSERSTAAATLQFATTPAEVDRALDALAATLSDKDPNVRVTAAQTLGGLIVHVKNPRGEIKASPEQVDKWTNQALNSVAKVLPDPDPSVRAAGIVGLGLVARQPETSGGGEVSVSDRVPRSGETAKKKGGGGRLKTAPRRPPEDLATALRTGSAKWTRQTAKEFYGYIDFNVPAELVAAINDESPNIRIAAIRTLHNFPLGLDAAIPALLATLEQHDTKDPSAETRLQEACREALQAAWPTPAVVPALTDALKNNHGESRALAALLLGRIGPEAAAAVPVLLATLKEPLDPAVPRSGQMALQQDTPCSAARALGSISSSDEVISALADVLKSELDYRHGAAANGLAQIGAPAQVAAPALVAAYNKWLDSKDQVNSGHWMTTALGRIGPGSAAESDAIKALIRSLDSKDGSIRSLAAESLGRFGKAAAAAAPKLRELKANERSGQAGKAFTDALTAIEGTSAPSPEANKKG